MTELIFQTTLKIVSLLTALATLLFRDYVKNNFITDYIDYTDFRGYVKNGFVTDYVDIQDFVKNAHH